MSEDIADGTNLELLILARRFELKKTIWILCTFTFILCAVGFAAAPATLSVDVLNPAVNKVIATNASTGVVLFTCGAGSTTCSKVLQAGTKVRLTAQTGPNFGFVKYTPVSGSASVCNNNPVCNFAITANTKVTADFHASTSLTVAVGQGTGVVKIKNASTGITLVTCSDPAPIGCSAGILVDTKLRIEGVAGNLQQFQGWNPRTGSAAICAGQGSTFFCEFVLKEKSSAVANFIPIP